MEEITLWNKWNHQTHIDLVRSSENYHLTQIDNQNKGKCIKTKRVEESN